MRSSPLKSLLTKISTPPLASFTQTTIKSCFVAFETVGGPVSPCQGPPCEVRVRPPFSRIDCGTDRLENLSYGCRHGAIRLPTRGHPPHERSITLYSILLYNIQKSSLGSHECNPDVALACIDALRETRLNLTERTPIQPRHTSHNIHLSMRLRIPDSVGGPGFAGFEADKVYL